MRARNPVSGMTMTVAMTKPVVTHAICSTVAPSADCRCGTATLTIDASIAPISVPKVTDSVTSHLLTGLGGVLVTCTPPHASLRDTLSPQGGRGGTGYA